MKQLTQKLKSGQMQIVEAPIPYLPSGMILMQNFYSLISAGTEGGTVKANRKGGSYHAVVEGAGRIRIQLI